MMTNDTSNVPSRSEGDLHLDSMLELVQPEGFAMASLPFSSDQPFLPVSSTTALPSTATNTNTNTEQMPFETLTWEVLSGFNDSALSLDVDLGVDETFSNDFFEPAPLPSKAVASHADMITEQKNKRARTIEAGNSNQGPHRAYATQQQPPVKKQRVAENTSTSKPFEMISFEDPIPTRFRDYQAEQWTEKFEELCEFVKKFGHCQVPHGYDNNKSLARWLKRQRYQYKLKNEGKASTMTNDRIAALNALGFVWNSHCAVWEERINELQEYKKRNGHCNVPSQFEENQKLATWVKCQRRQYKLFLAGKQSNMTMERVTRLQRMGFVWELRFHPPKQS